MDVRTDHASSTRVKRLADLDGPRGWPVLGNLLQLDLPRFHEQLEGWARVHGPLYRLRMGPRNVLVVARPDLIASNCATGLMAGAGFEPCRR